MALFKDSDNTVYNWVSQNLLDESSYIKNDLTLAIKINQTIVAGVIFSFLGNVCYLSIYASSPLWCNRQNLSKIFDIALAKAKIVKCCVSHKNIKINRLLLGLNLHREGLLRFARQNGSHEIVYSITKAELRKKRWYLCQE